LSGESPTEYPMEIAVVTAGGSFLVILLNSLTMVWALCFEGAPYSVNL